MTSLTWQSALGNEKQKEYFVELLERVKQAREAGSVIYPPQPDVFNALKYTPLDKVNVVILGQDPYHGPNQAHGLCFSVQAGVKTPPSLKNMYKELLTDIDGFVEPNHGTLTSWAEQGVLLLNATLTVRAHQAGSHQKKGWEQFTDAVIKTVSSELEGVVFLLWGGFAKKKSSLIDKSKHHILTSGHPSPLSANRGLWFGNQHFSKTNGF